MSSPIDSKSPTTTYQREVDLHDAWSTAYWTMVFGISHSQLHEAVNAVGTAPVSIRQFLIAKRKVFVRPRFQIAPF